MLKSLFLISTSLKITSGNAILLTECIGGRKSDVRLKILNYSFKML